MLNCGFVMICFVPVAPGKAMQVGEMLEIPVKQGGHHVLVWTILLPVFINRQSPKPGQAWGQLTFSIHPQHDC